MQDGVLSARKPKPLSPREATDQLATITQALTRCTRQLKGVISGQISDCELTETEFFLLWFCRQAGEQGVAQKEMTDAIGVSPAQMSATVDRLRTRGLMEARRTAIDRRRQQLILSPEGRLVLDEALGNLSGFSQRLVASLSESELTTLCSLTERLVKCAKEPTAPAPLRIFNPSEDEPVIARPQGRTKS